MDLERIASKVAAFRQPTWWSWIPENVPESQVKEMRRAISEARYDVTVPIPPWGSAKVILYLADRGASINVEIMASREALYKRLKFGPMYFGRILLDKEDVEKLFTASGYDAIKSALAEIFMKYWKEYLEPLHYPEAKPMELDAEGYPIYDD